MMLRRSLIAVALAALVSACNGSSSSPAPAPAPIPTASPAPTATPNPATATGILTTSTTQSSSLVLGPIGPGDSGTTAVPPTNVVSHLSLVFSLGQPAGTPTVAAIHRVPRTIGGASISTFGFYTLTPDVTVTMPTPAFSMTFPAGTLPNGASYVAMFDPGNAGAGWNTISGPGTVVGNTISWTAGNYPFTFVAARTYSFSFFTTISTLAVATPSPTPTVAPTLAPSPTPTPTPTPTPSPTPPIPSLVRFVQGSPDSATVDVCIDQLPFGGASPAPAVAYGQRSNLYSIAGGVTHTVSVYDASAGSPSAVCPTAPASFAGSAPLEVATLTIGTNVRWTIVLGGTAASATLGLYVFNEPTYPTTPGGLSAITHNAAPAFSIGKSGVGFGLCTTTVTPCTSTVALTGSQNRAAPSASTPSTTSINGTVSSGLASIPAGFYDGVGVLAGTPVPITSVAAPSPVAFQPYVVQLYALDGPAGGLNLLSFIEQTTGFGF
jgi:uncharacterized protein DUF4397